MEKNGVPNPGLILPKSPLPLPDSSFFLYSCWKSASVKKHAVFKMTPICNVAAVAMFATASFMFKALSKGTPNNSNYTEKPLDETHEGKPKILTCRKKPPDDTPEGKP